MGRFLLLLVAAATVGGSLISLTNRNSFVRAAERRGASVNIVLARHAAQSGYNITAGQVARDYAARLPVTDVHVDDGTYGAYDATVDESGRGPLDLSITGRYENGWRIIAERFPLTTLSAPFIVASDELTFDPVGDDFEVRGLDRRQPGAIGQEEQFMPGQGITATAMVVANSSLQSAVLDELTDAQRVRVSGQSNEGDVTIAPVPDLVQAIYDEALLRGTVSPDGHVYNSETIGAPGSPAILVFNGDVELNGSTRGYGLLVVNGNLTLRNTSRWEGVILVQAVEDESLNVVLEDDATVVGSLVLFGREAGLPGGHFDVDVFRPGDGKKSYGGMVRAYHKHEYDDAYDVTHVDVLNGPGVDEHWRAFKSEYAGRTLTLELFNTTNGSGILELVSPAGTYTVPNCSSFTTTIVPDEVTMLRPTFVDLKQLRGTSPRPVWVDPVNRDGAYTIRIYDGGTLVYAVSVYEHVKDPREALDCGTTPSDDDSDEGGELYGHFDVSLRNNGALYYSEEAIAQLGFVLESVKDEWRIAGVVHSSSIVD